MGEQLDLFGRPKVLLMRDAVEIYWELEGNALPSKSHKTDKRRIIEILGTYYLHHLSTWHVNHYKSIRKQDNATLKGSTLNREHTRITRILNAFYEWREVGKYGPYDFSELELPKKNPGELVPKEPEKSYVRKRVVTPEEFRRYIDYAHPEVRKIVTVMILTLLRRKDVQLLQVNHLDTALNTISGVQSKTKKDFTVPAAFTVRVIFNDAKIKYQREYVCDFTNFRRFHERAMRESGVFFWLSDLRRSGATLLLMQHVDLRTIQNFLGHQSLKMTERYLSPAPEVSHKAGKILESNFLPPQQGIDYKYAEN